MKLIKTIPLLINTANINKVHDKKARGEQIYTFIFNFRQAWFKYTKNVQDLTLALNNSFLEQPLFSSVKKNRMIDLLSSLDQDLPEEATDTGYLRRSAEG